MLHNYHRGVAGDLKKVPVRTATIFPTISIYNSTSMNSDTIPPSCDDFYFPNPPLHFGLCSSGFFPCSSHCWGVLATTDSACTPEESSDDRQSFTSLEWRNQHYFEPSILLSLPHLCLSMSFFPWNPSLTTSTLKCVSDPRGTLCMKDSFKTWR